MIELQSGQVLYPWDDCAANENYTVKLNVWLIRKVAKTENKYEIIITDD